MRLVYLQYMFRQRRFYEIKSRIDLAQVMEWFHENYMVLNADKSHNMCLEKSTENANFSFGRDTYVDRKEEKFMDIIFYYY